jgi:hypothetical protein
LAVHPWDGKDSMEEEDLDETAIGNFGDDNNGAGAPNNRADTYSFTANDTALRFGIQFTTKQYHITKLSKVLSDANTSHFC